MSLTDGPRRVRPVAVRAPVEGRHGPVGRCSHADVVAAVASNAAHFSSGVSPHDPSRSGDIARTAEVADRFDDLIRSLTVPRHAAGDAAPDDVTTELVRLRDSDAASCFLMRLWCRSCATGLAATSDRSPSAPGVPTHWFAIHPAVQEELRPASDAELAVPIDEILRIDHPFVSNRRVATRDVRLGGTTIDSGDLVVINWTAANRDPDAFGDPEDYDPRGNVAANLVCDIGPHV